MNKQFMTEEQFDEVNRAVMEALDDVAKELGGDVDPLTEDTVFKALSKFRKVEKTPRNDLAKRGNKAAEKFLASRGYKILERDYECDHGAIDFISCDDETLVFVEVKTRLFTDKGMPDEAIIEEKRSRFENIAMSYLSEHEELEECGVRFDIIGIVAMDNGKAMVRHHINCLG